MQISRLCSQIFRASSSGLVTGNVCVVCVCVIVRECECRSVCPHMFCRGFPCSSQPFFLK